jgi:hypothetical protein
LEDHEWYSIEEIGEDGEQIAPASRAKKVLSQCGVLVRDNIRSPLLNGRRQRRKELVMSTGEPKCNTPNFNKKKVREIQKAKFQTNKNFSICI